MLRPSPGNLCPPSSAPIASASPLSAASSGVLERALAWLVALSSAAMGWYWSSDGDLGFHLATGREILTTGRIPSHNVLSYTQPWHPWRLHQGWPGVLFECVERSFGIAGLITLKMLVVAATFGVVYRTARSLGARALPSAFACLLAAAASAFRFEIRPYLFTHLTLALIQLALANYACGINPRRWLAMAVTVATVACHLHAGAIDGFIVMSLFALGCALEPLSARFGRAPRTAAAGQMHALRWSGAVLCAVGLAAATLALYHPLGASILRFPFEMGSDSYLAQHLVEFRSAWSFPPAMLAAYWVCLGLWTLAALTQARRVHLGWLLIGLAYALLSLRFARMAFAFAIVAAPVLALWFGGFRLRVRPRLAALALVCAALATPLFVLRDHTPGFGYEPRVWPMAHFHFIRERRVQGHGFLSDAWAGPFLGLFYPERRVFFDNRLEAYSRAFVREVYQHIRYAEPGWDRLLDAHGVEFLLLRYTTPAEARFQGGRPNLRQRLAADPRYTLLRFDDLGELFVRSAGVNASLATQLGIPGVDPDRRVFLRPPAACAPALWAALERGERSATLFGMTALALAQRGQLGEALDLAARAAQLAPHDAWATSLAAKLRRECRPSSMD